DESLERFLAGRLNDAVYNPRGLRGGSLHLVVSILCFRRQSGSGCGCAPPFELFEAALGGGQLLLNISKLLGRDGPWVPGIVTRYELIENQAGDYEDSCEDGRAEA